ncbi:MAG: MFS transporter [Clostridia bacterium]|nr:MFS transporter [Clostridia bacterium]
MSTKVKKVKPQVDKTNPDYIPLKEKLAYGVGALMDGGGVALMSCVMLNYMTDGLGIEMAIASTIMMLAKLWDAITDPLMGFISDNTRSRFGRRKPYMFVGGIMLLVCLLLLFLPIKDYGMNVPGMVAYMVVMYLLWNTFSTLTQVPYCSLASDISPSFKERNNANTVKLVFSSAAAGIAYVVPLLVLEAYTEPEAAFLPAITATQFWLIISILFGLLFGGGLVITALFVKERIQPITPKVKFDIKSFFRDYASPFRNKSFRWHIVMYASAFMCMDMISALAVYYATDVWHGAKLFGMNFSSLFIVAPLMVAAVVAFPLVRFVMDKKTKQFAFRIGLPFYILGGILLAVLDPEWTPPIVIPIVAFFMGLGFGGAQMMPWIIFPDTVDVAEFATGERPTGSYSGMMTLIRKCAGALGVGMIGWILVDYVESDNSVYIQQTDATLLTIRLLMGIAIAVLISIAMFASFKFKVTNKKLTRMRYFMDLNRAGQLDTITEEEAAERDQMIAELYGKVK